MRRRNLLIILLISVCIWAFGPQDSEGAYAQQESPRVIAATPPVTSLTIEDPSSEPTTDTNTLDLPSVSDEPAGEEVNIIKTEPVLQPTARVITEPQADKQWALNEIDMNGLWQMSTGSSQIRVAVLDTGIDDSHPDLSGQVVAETNIATSGKPNDSHGHGTHIAGIIAAKDNNEGIIGIAPDCALLNVKVADDMGRCQASDLAEGIIWAADNGADVINVSIEIHEPYSKLEKAINYAWEKGSLVVAAAGNGGGDSPVYPASYENCLAVSAIDSDQDLTTLSNHGDWVDLAAPGSEIYSTLPEKSYGYKSGTSFACAHISGIAALLFDLVNDTNDNGRTNDEVADILKSSCQDINLSGIGSGLINATVTLSYLP